MRTYLKYRLPLLATLATVCLMLATALGSSAGAQTAEQPRLFAADSFWNQPLASDAPLDRSSDTLVASLRQEVQQDLASGTGPWINTTSYSTPLYTVPADQPTVRVTLDSTSTAPWRYALEAAFDQVPIPAGAVPANGTDGQMTIWQPSTDRLWEFWKASKQTDGWHARHGGAIENVSEDPGYYTTGAWPGATHQWGASAIGVPIIGGVMTLEDLAAGEIDHALAMDVPIPREDVYSWPAQDTEGLGLTEEHIPEGARFRIDPAVNLDSLSMHPVTRMMAEAAQTYGLVVRDKTKSVVTIDAEDPSPTGTNPYREPNGGHFQGASPSTILRQFPWEHLELLKMSTCTIQALPCPPEGQPPTAEVVSPSDGAGGVSSSTNIVVTFSEAMDRQATEAAFQLTQSGLPVAGSFSWNSTGTKLTFDPSSQLATGSYSAGVSTSATDEAGNALYRARTWSFTVEDVSPPTVTAVSPSDGAAGVASSANVVVTFSEPMNRQATEAAFALAKSGLPVAGSFSWNSAGTELTFKPSSPLATGGYSASVSTSATDEAGHALPASRLWSFTVDATSPTIQSVSPSDGATGVTSSANVVVTFSEPMNRQATEAAFALAKSGLPVAGSFSWNSAGTELTFDPSASLASGGYAASVSTAATDQQGNALGGASSWSFTVAAAPPTGSAPNAVVILAGSRRSGNAGSLAADDNTFYSVNSTSGTTRTVSWYGRFDGVPSSVGSLAVTYSGKNSRNCSQTIAIRRFTTSSWAVLDSRSVGTNEIKVPALNPPGAPSDYVSGTGTVQVRVVCKTTAGTFYSSGDLVELRR